ncbi:MAG: hypothetical protein IBJ07_14795 [Rhizobiaceae bacterium]|nr:hypothetical protein [Rhizobiaceae bacterium]
MEDPIDEICEQEVAYPSSFHFKLDVLRTRLQWKAIRPFDAAHLLVGIDPCTPIDAAFQDGVRLRLLPGLQRPRRKSDWHRHALDFAREVKRIHRLLVSAYGRGATDAREWMKRAGELNINPPWQKFSEADRELEAWLFGEPRSGAAFRASQQTKAKAQNERLYGQRRQKVFEILDSFGEQFPDSCFTKGNPKRKRPRRLAETKIVNWIGNECVLPALPNGQDDGESTVARYVQQWFGAHPHVKNSARPASDY